MHICLYLEPCYIRDGHRSLGGGRDFYRSGMEIVVRIGLIRIGRLISKNNRCSFNHGRNSDVLLNISDQRMAFSFCTEWRLECIIYKESVSTTSAFEQKLVTVQICMETEDRDIASEVGLQPSCCSDSTFTHINLARQQIDRKLNTQSQSWTHKNLADGIADGPAIHLCLCPKQ